MDSRFVACSNFDCEDAADDYAFQLSKEDGTRAYGALRCPKVGENL